jgi:hypothetical protein
MTITHVISGLRAGGAEHFVLELCRQSKLEAGINMEVVTLSGADEISHKFRGAGISVASASAGNKPAKALHAYNGLRLLLYKRPSFIHAHMFHACMVACIVKYVPCLHGSVHC